MARSGLLALGLTVAVVLAGCVGNPARCGDGVVSPGEECDDGNTVGGDGCDSQCRVEPKLVRLLATHPIVCCVDPPPPMYVRAPTSGTTWDLDRVCGARADALPPTAACKPYDFVTTYGRQVIAIAFNRQLQVADVQTAPDDCTMNPATLSVAAVDATTGLPVTQSGPLRTCYQDGAVVAGGAPAILVFFQRSGDVYKSRPDQGRALTPNTRYTVATLGPGLRDRNGNYVEFTVNVTTVPNEGLWTDPSSSYWSSSTCYYTYPSAGKEIMCKSPGAPWYTGVTASSVTVNWAAIPGATRYDLARALDAGGAPSFFIDLTLFPIAATTFTDTTVASDTTYWYVIVSATDGTLGTPWGDQSVVTTPLDGPPAPAFGTATCAAGGCDVPLTWTAVTGATGYVVEQADDVFGVPAAFGPVSGTLAGTTYTATALVQGTPYWFRVVAENATGPSTGAPVAFTP